MEGGDDLKCHVHNIRLECCQVLGIFPCHLQAVLVRALLNSHLQTGEQRSAARQLCILLLPPNDPDVILKLLSAMHHGWSIASAHSPPQHSRAEPSSGHSNGCLVITYDLTTFASKHQKNNYFVA